MKRHNSESSLTKTNGKQNDDGTDNVQECGYITSKSFLLIRKAIFRRGLEIELQNEDKSYREVVC